ncbi:MAG: AAA family ATPase [Alphaproteobacteria bacterium]|nr:AAA family ATPase [Alphaproteobacteria bacterium]
MKNENNMPEVATFNYNIYTADELLALKLPPREWFLYPLIPQKGISIICAERGAGKTYFALAIACAVASGFGFLNFTAETPRKVLYIDGEMDGSEIQERLNRLIVGFRTEDKIVKTENLSLFCSDFQGDNPMPDLATQEGRERLEQELEGVDLIIIDNVHFLYTAKDENSSGTWIDFNRWSREQRGKGRSVLWVHHTGKDPEKGGRGSSTIETLMNASLTLIVPKDHRPENGAFVFTKYTKMRGATGQSVRGIYTKLISCGELNPVGEQMGLKWEKAEAPQSEEIDDIINFLKEGKNAKEIVDITGASKTKVYEVRKRYKRAEKSKE